MQKLFLSVGLVFCAAPLLAMMIAMTALAADLFFGGWIWPIPSGMEGFGLFCLGWVSFLVGAFAFLAGIDGPRSGL